MGPLSNAAGAQSIPQIKAKGKNTAINAMPPGVTPSDLDLACETWSDADLVPRVPLVHGFCFGVKKEVIESIGFFDEENFKLFYGEENDYCFRALAAGFELAVATNTFVYHRKSRSIDEEKRVVHMAEAWKRLRELYGAEQNSARLPAGRGASPARADTQGGGALLPLGEGSEADIQCFYFKLRKPSEPGLLPFRSRTIVSAQPRN